jgi:Transposase C of IS166 homeodomain
MEAAVSNLPNDVEALKALVLSMTRRATDAEAELANARAKASADQALIAHLTLQIAKLNRERFGPHSERSRRLLEQLELQLGELEACASEDHPAPLLVPGMRRHAPVEARRGRDRDAGGNPAPVEGHPDRAREVLLPGLRADHAAARAIPRRAAWLGGTQLPRNAAVREVRAAPTLEPAGRPLRPRGCALEPVDAG